MEFFNINLELFEKLLASAMVPVLVSGFLYLLKRKTNVGNMPEAAKQIIAGIIFGGVAILGTEFGVDIGGATANARDAAPLCAGLLFGGPAGIIAGIIGGAERWFATAWGAGTYSRIACTVSTILAGFYAAYLRKFVFDEKRPAAALAFATGGVMEIIHLTILFLTHLTDSEQAFEIVKICTFPMIFCNGISVFLSVLLVKVISTGIHRKEKRRKSLSQLFQTPMLIAVVIAYLCSTVFVYFLQTYSARESACRMMQLNIDDVKQEILDASDRHIINITRSIAEEVEQARTDGTEFSLKELAGKYDVSNIWYVNEDGIVEDASDGRVGYDMASDADLPEEEQQSCKFLVLLTDECSEYVQEYRSLSSDSSAMKKTAGVSMENGGFIQTGYNADCFQDEVSSQLADITKNRRIGEAGHLAIVDRNMEVVSDIGSTNTAISASDVEINEKTLSDDGYSTEINGVKCLALASESEGYYIVAVLPETEVYDTRNAMVYINSFMEIIVFAALFLNIYGIVRNVVVKNLHRINGSLGKIIEGDLNTTVDVVSSEELASLSGDINTTVSTLKQYIDDAARRIDSELAFAKSIQHSALPSVFPPYPNRKEFDIFASMDTAKEVGGDFYDFCMPDSNHIAILIADVSGKGIPAAMFMMTAKTMIKNFAEAGLSVDEIFTRANEKLCENNDAGMFVTAWMGIIDTETGVLEFANAGHNPPLLCRKGSFEYLRLKAGFVMAGMDGFVYRKQTVQLNPGDRIFLYTDGVTEAADLSETLYGEQRLKNYLNSVSAKTASEVVGGVKKDIDDFAGEAEQADDITMLMFDFKGSAENAIEFREYPAEVEQLDNATDFITSALEEAGASMKTVTQVSVAFEEIFVNVAHYAYRGGKGNVKVGLGISDDTATIILKDSGKPFDPFSKEDPDITLSAEERDIGGLGIFMTKQIMDECRYEYIDSTNIVTLKKKLK